MVIIHWLHNKANLTCPLRTSLLVVAPWKHRNFILTSFICCVTVGMLILMTRKKGFTEKYLFICQQSNGLDTRWTDTHHAFSVCPPHVRMDSKFSKGLSATEPGKRLIRVASSGVCPSFISLIGFSGFIRLLQRSKPCMEMSFYSRVHP